MKIAEIVKEYVETSQAQANATTLDPRILRQKEKETLEKEGKDPSASEVIQDFPS